VTTLRPYQVAAIEQCRARIADRPLLCLPTGAGKGYIFAEIARRSTERGHRTLVLVHRQELLEQAQGHGVGEVHTYQSLIRREAVPDVDLLIVDEAHLSVARQFKAVIERHNPRWLLGCSATPARMSGEPLGQLFGCIIEPASFADLAAQGYLCNPAVFDAGHPDLEGVGSRGGDYVLSDLRQRVAPLTGNIVATFKRLGTLPALGFAVDVQHAEELAAEFNAAGIPSIALSSDSSDRERIRDFPGVVWNCALFIEGLDRPELSTAIIARPTRSLVFHRQMFGRVARPKAGGARVIDHAGNTARLGLPTDPVKWSLDGRVRVQTTPVRACQACLCCYSPFVAACPECGHVNAVKRRARPKSAEGDLAPSKGKAPRDPAKMEATYRSLCRIGAERGYKPGWAKFVYRSRYGEWPTFRAGQSSPA